jgi:predicted transcriptional regulator
MKLKDIIKVLDAEVLCGEHLLEREVETGFGCDLMSEMLAFANSHTLLITSLTNEHVIHTAEIMDAVGVVFVGGKRPAKEIIRKAELNNIPLLSTPFLMFKCCGLLFVNGLKGCMRDATQ